MVNRVGFGWWVPVGLGGVVAGLLWNDQNNRKIWSKIHEDSTPAGISTLRNKQCVVYLESNEDYNGALNLMRANVDLKALQGWKIPVIYRRIMDSNEIRPLLDQIKSQQNKIPVLILSGHGRVNSMQMGKGELSVKSLKNAMDPGSHIILATCSGGETDAKGMSLAKQISEANPLTTVTAGKGTILASTLQTYVSF